LHRKKFGTWQDRASWFLIFLGLVMLLIPKTTRIVITVPIQTALLAPLRGTSILKRNIFRLKAENRRLSLLATELAVENARLETVSRHTSAFPEGLDLVSAPIITRDLITLERYLVVSRGRKHKIRLGAPALSADGIIGKVIAVGNHQALIQTIFDPDLRIAVTNLRSRITALARPDGYHLLKLDYAPKASDFKPGDTIVTAGLGGTFPKGLRLGIVVSVLDEPNDLFKSVKLRPFCDIARLEEVFLLRIPPGTSRYQKSGWLDNIGPLEIHAPEEPDF